MTTMTIDTIKALVDMLSDMTIADIRNTDGLKTRILDAMDDLEGYIEQDVAELEAYGEFDGRDDFHPYATEYDESCDWADIDPDTEDKINELLGEYNEDTDLYSELEEILACVEGRRIVLE